MLLFAQRRLPMLTQPPPQLSAPPPCSPLITILALVQACLRAFTADEELEGDEAHRCEKCRDRSHSTKALRISRCPPVLVLHLKRFSLADPADYLSPLEKVTAHKLGLWELICWALWGVWMVGLAAWLTCQAGHEVVFYEGQDLMTMAMLVEGFKRFSLADPADYLSPLEKVASFGDMNGVECGGLSQLQGWVHVM